MSKNKLGIVTDKHRVNDYKLVPGKVPLSKSHINQLKRQVQSFYKTTIDDNTDSREIQALHAISRRYAELKDLPEGLTALTKNANATEFIIIMDAIVRMGLEKKQLSERTSTAVNTCLQKLDTILIECLIRKEYTDHQDLYCDVRSALEIMINKIPFFFHGRILSLTRLFLSETPLPLKDNEPLDKITRRIQLRETLFWVGMSLGSGVLCSVSSFLLSMAIPGLISACALGLSIALALSLSLLTAVGATASLVGVFVCAKKATDSSPKNWELPAVEKTPVLDGP